MSVARLWSHATIEIFLFLFLKNTKDHLVSQSWNVVTSLTRVLLCRTMVIDELISWFHPLTVIEILSQPKKKPKREKYAFNPYLLTGLIFSSRGDCDIVQMRPICLRLMIKMPCGHPRREPPFNYNIFVHLRVHCHITDWLMSSVLFCSVLFPEIFILCVFLHCASVKL